jgi:hypothetical protein
MIREAILEDEYCQDITVNRRVQLVDNHGRVTTTDTALTFTGVIQAGVGDALNRLPEADRNSEAIRVFSLDELRCGTATNKADIIVHNGKRYEVMNVLNYWDEYSDAVCRVTKNG